MEPRAEAIGSIQINSIRIVNIRAMVIDQGKNKEKIIKVSKDLIMTIDILTNSMRKSKKDLEEGI